MCPALAVIITPYGESTIRLGLGWWRSRGWLVDIVSSTRVVRRGRLLQRDVIIVVLAVVALVRVESLARVLVWHRALGGSVLRWGRLLVLRLVVIVLIRAPPAVAVLRLLAVGVVGARHHPAGAVARVHAPPSAATVRDTAPGQEEDEEEDDDDGGQNPAAPVRPVAPVAGSISEVVARGTGTTAVNMLAWFGSTGGSCGKELGDESRLTIVWRPDLLPVQG